MPRMSHKLPCCGNDRVIMQQWTAAIPRMLPISRCTGTDSCQEKIWNWLCSRQQPKNTITTLENSAKRNTQPQRLRLVMGHLQWRTWSQKTAAGISVPSVSTVIQTHVKAEQKPHWMVGTSVAIISCTVGGPQVQLQIRGSYEGLQLPKSQLTHTNRDSGLLSLRSPEHNKTKMFFTGSADLYYSLTVKLLNACLLFHLHSKEAW